MQSNICWSTKYYVPIEEYEVCVVYHNEKQPAPWEVYVQTEGGNGLQLLIDKFRILGVQFDIVENRINLMIKSQQSDETFIGGCLPPVYHELLERIEKLIYEILRDKKGDVENG